MAHLVKLNQKIKFNIYLLLFVTNKLFNYEISNNFPLSEETNKISKKIYKELTFKL